MVSMSVFIVFCILAFMLGGVVALVIFCCLVMAGKDKAKPIKQRDEDGFLLYLCPVCKTIICGNDEHCYKCGKEIDWS